MVAWGRSTSIIINKIDTCQETNTLRKVLRFTKKLLKLSLIHRKRSFQHTTQQEEGICENTNAALPSQTFHSLRCQQARINLEMSLPPKKRKSEFTKLLSSIPNLYYSARGNSFPSVMPPHSVFCPHFVHIGRGFYLLIFNLIPIRYY